VTLDTGPGRHAKYPPYAFTEQGVAMLSSVLRSPRAVQVNIEIMRAFVIVDHGAYLARSQDVRSGVFRAELAARVSEGIYRDRTARAEPRRGDLLYSREGTYFGIAAEVPPGMQVCLG
jgi:hypothetical protein